MKIYVRSSLHPWKTKYEVRYIRPDGRDCLLGGSDNRKKANQIAEQHAKHIFENPFESNSRKFSFLENLYVVDTEYDEDGMLTGTEDYIDGLMSEIDSKIRLESKQNNRQYVYMNHNPFRFRRRNRYIRSSQSPEYVIWVYDGDDNRWKMWGGTYKSYVDDDFLYRINHPNYPNEEFNYEHNYLDVIVLPNGQEPEF